MPSTGLGIRLMIGTNRVEFFLSKGFEVMTGIKGRGLGRWLSCTNIRA